MRETLIDKAESLMKQWLTGALEGHTVGETPRQGADAVLAVVQRRVRGAWPEEADRIEIVVTGGDDGEPFDVFLSIEPPDWSDTTLASGRPVRVRMVPNFERGYGYVVQVQPRNDDLAGMREELLARFTSPSAPPNPPPASPSR